MVYVTKTISIYRGSLIIETNFAVIRAILGFIMKFKYRHPSANTFCVAAKKPR